MNISDIEQRLESVSLVDPSDNYFKKGRVLARGVGDDLLPLKLGFQFAVAASLIVSLSLNFSQFLDQDQQDNILIEGIESVETASANAAGVVDNSIPALLAEVASTGNAVFNFLCFTSTSVIVDNSFFVGELSGFGEWATIEIPEFFRVGLSLQPVRDWVPVGEYRDGTISIELEDMHLLTLNGASLGPQGSRLKGRFTVFGEIEKIAANASGGSDVEKSISAVDYPEALVRNVTLASQANPFRSIASVSLGVDTILDPMIRNIIKPMLESGSCG